MMNQTPVKPTTTGTRSARKVRSACVRCRNRRIKVCWVGYPRNAATNSQKCDGETPACRNCLKVNAACVDVDGRLGDVLLPRR